MGIALEEIKDKLRTVNYPEYGINIIDLGLVYDIKILENIRMKQLVNLMNLCYPIPQIIILI